MNLESAKQPGAWLQWLAAAVVPLVLFFDMTAVSRIVTLTAVGAGLLFCLAKGHLAVLRERVSPLSAAVALYVAVSLCSGLGSSFGKYALRESCKILAAYGAFLLVMHARLTARRVMEYLTGTASIIAFLCIEAATTNVVMPLFRLLWALVHSAAAEAGYESGIRVTGIYGNANITGGILGAALPIALYLVLSAGERRGWRAWLAYVALGLEAMAFLLSFSMGAMAMFAVACLVYLALIPAQRRMRLLLMMVETVAVTFACTFAATLGLGKTGAAAVIPVAAALICGLAIGLIDRVLGAPVGDKLQNCGKQAAWACVGVVVLAVGYLVLALHITGGTNVDGGLNRAVYLAPGSYTVQVDGAAMQARIYTQNSKDLMMHTETTLYEGNLADAAIEVPEDSQVVWVEMTGTGALNAVTFSDGTKLHLGYPLLPGFAANRLQALRANQNFIQRLVFFRDGIRLWKTNPITGVGLGGVEGRVTQVQDFYYESRYVHNQPIQILAEAGVVGLAAFAFLLVGAIWTLRRKYTPEQAEAIAALGACVAMLFGHSLVEVVWSHQEFQTMALAIFAAICLLPDAKPRPASAPTTARSLAVTGMIAVAVVFGGLNAANLYVLGRMVSYQAETPEAFVREAVRLDKLDVYDDNSLKLSVIQTALQDCGEEYYVYAEDAALSLRARKEFAAARSVAVYYDLPWGMMKSFFDDCRMGLMQEASNPWAWNRTFYTFRWVGRQLSADQMPDYIQGVLEMKAQLDEFNQGRMEQIALDQVEQDYLDVVAAVENQSSEMAASVIQAYLKDAQFN